jgi:hypothetical protein
MILHEFKIERVGTFEIHQRREDEKFHVCFKPLYPGTACVDFHESFEDLNGAAIAILDFLDTINKSQAI